jgi:hypothetical protein
VVGGRRSMLTFGMTLLALALIGPLRTRGGAGA